MLLNPLLVRIGFSPCPNDTFMFHSIVSKNVSVPEYDIVEYIHDVALLNELAFEEEFDITKMSFYTWLNVKEHYHLMHNGAAMGYGCGPILISKKPIKDSDISKCKIAFPGEWTTAHLLFRLWNPSAENRIFVRFDDMFDVLRSGKADCAVIIHESRFTFENAGFHKIIDLGQWLEDITGLPVPLGCIASHRTISDKMVQKIDEMIGLSIRQAMENPEPALAYAKKYAQEMDPKIMEKHVKTFVNDFSLELGEKGMAAIEKLEEMAKKANVLRW